MAQYVIVNEESAVNTDVLDSTQEM